MKINEDRSCGCDFLFLCYQKLTVWRDFFLSITRFLEMSLAMTSNTRIIVRLSSPFQKNIIERPTNKVERVLQLRVE